MSRQSLFNMRKYTYFAYLILFYLRGPVRRYLYLKSEQYNIIFNQLI